MSGCSHTMRVGSIRPGYIICGDCGKVLKKPKAQAEKPAPKAEIKREGTMQTSQTLGERVKMLEAGCAVKDAEITRLHAEVARLRAIIASPNGHHPDCGYQLDQYPQECTCERSISRQPPDLCEDEGCPHHGTPHVCVTRVE